MPPRFISPIFQTKLQPSNLRLPGSRLDDVDVFASNRLLDLNDGLSVRFVVDRAAAQANLQVTRNRSANFKDRESIPGQYFKRLLLEYARVEVKWLARSACDRLILSLNPTTTNNYF